ncbi:HNH endonuclease family protein [Enhygromyxa salina]|uniref:GmrSD restriction endonucleases C-terminal domain-containing protein n=1 Tax=Enhygromyxa salina TaxID=215803 RepID=A0A2S9YTW4_9BACT|nr:HNH endonuclease family protein [Enhygromyxa salina]PRQ08555.1 hypothetical protein ENSA7_18410 [Enhygromyxa salina]
MLTTRGLAVALLTVAACDPTTTRPEPPAPSPTVAEALLIEGAVVPAELRVPAPASAYERGDWPQWIDADRDCQDTRTEVLIAESYEPIVFEEDRSCEVATGRWQCPYSGKIVSEVHLLDVDHLVPLANAHRSGGATWTTDQRRRYANDLDHAEHLIAVDHTANRSKGDKGPEAWLPTSEDYRCTYVREWVAIKQRWQLGMNEAEAAAVRGALEACNAGLIPALPQTQRPNDRAGATEVEASERDTRAAGECCRVCKKGKACGDACIAASSNCTKPAGCACDG